MVRAHFNGGQSQHPKVSPRMEPQLMLKESLMCVITAVKRVTGKVSYVEK